MFKTQEYQHLLEAERLLSESMGESATTAKDRAMVASALVRVIEQKRVLRKQPAPKPIDVSEPRARRGRAAKPAVLPMPSDVPTTSDASSAGAAS